MNKKKFNISKKKKRQIKRQAKKAKLDKRLEKGSVKSFHRINEIINASNLDETIKADLLKRNYETSSISKS